MSGILSNYGRSLEEVWAHTSIWAGLNNAHREDILKVQELFSLHIGTGIADIPDAIRFVKERSGFLYIFNQTSYLAANRASAIQYQAETWHTRMRGRGKLRTYALDMISEICSYQTARKLPNDSAECMFLEELKHWATFELALYELREDNLVEIEKRVRYLEAVLAQDSLFYSLVWRERTVQKIIVESCLRLKYQVIPEIKNEIALKCAREQLSEFRFELKEALHAGTYFLYHIFRDSRKTDLETLTVDRMLRHEGDTMDTSSGRLLYHILSSGAFAEAFPNDNIEIRKRMKEAKLEEEEVSPENNMDTATLFDSHGNLCMPRSLYLEMTQKDPETVKQDPVMLTKDVLSNLFDKRLGTKHTGIEAGFHNHPYVAEQLVKSHAALQELAKFVQIIIKAERCAGGGGDLLIYGFANKQLNALLETYRALVKSVRSHFEVLLRIAELRFQQLVDKNQAEPERNTFVPHYRQIHAKFYHFDNQLARTEKCCDTILIKANSLSLYERFQKLQRDTHDFIASSDRFAGHLHRVLNIPYNSAIGQQIMIHGPQIPNADALLKSVKKGDGDVLPFAFNLLEVNSVGAVQMQTAPPSLLMLTEKGEENAVPLSPNDFRSNRQLSMAQSRSSEPVVTVTAEVEEPKKNKKSKKREKEEKKIKEVAKKEKEIELLEKKLRDVEALSVSKEFKLSPLEDVLPSYKPPKAVFSFPRESISMRNITEICLKIQPKLLRIKPASAIFRLESAFEEVEAISSLLRFLELHAHKVHTLDLSDNHFDDEAISALAFFLQNSRCSVKKLVCSNCSLRNSHTVQLAEVLKVNQSVRKLNLVDNMLTDDALLNFYASFFQNRSLPIRRVKLYNTTADHDANSIPFTPIVVKMMDRFYAEVKNSDLVVLFHSGADITKGDVEKSKIFTRYNYECEQRQREQKTKKIRRKEEEAIGESAQITTCLYFKDVIHIAQVYERSTGSSTVPFSTFQYAFANGIYGCQLKQDLEMLLAMACRLNVLKSSEDGSSYTLHRATRTWEIPISLNITNMLQAEETDLLWQMMFLSLLRISAEGKRLDKDELLGELSASIPLKVYNDTQVDLMLELFVLLGVVAFHPQDSLCIINDGKYCPPDYTQFPGFAGKVFGTSPFPPTSNVSPTPSLLEGRKKSSSKRVPSPSPSRPTSTPPTGSSPEEPRRKNSALTKLKRRSVKLVSVSSGSGKSPRSEGAVSLSFSDAETESESETEYRGRRLSVSSGDQRQVAESPEVERNIAQGNESPEPEGPPVKRSSSRRLSMSIKSIGKKKKSKGTG
eukprot:TRINITY_DN6743_c0_g1_i1.p1 TRINITY_DN6743_c0_g1~~TRINITY_DN6743_c0_g1_i1.p1  ORF type:complete len:1288 (-),score=233.38 TRINITY_DN6743_c0_g1_i1:86-3949(-)